MNSECVKSPPVAFARPGAGAAPSSGDAAEAAPHFERQGLALAVLFVGAFLAPLDYFIVNLAMPSIHQGLAASEYLCARSEIGERSERSFGVDRALVVEGRWLHRLSPPVF